MCDANKYVAVVMDARHYNLVDGWHARLARFLLTPGDSFCGPSHTWELLGNAAEAPKPCK